MPALGSASVYDAALDARPALPVADATAFDEAVALRDRLADAVVEALRSGGMRADVLVSEPGNWPAWLRLEVWTPAKTEGARRRSTLEISIEAKPLHQHRLVCSARLVRDGRSCELSRQPGFSEKDAVDWARYCVGRGPKPSTIRPVSTFLRRLGAFFVPPLDPQHNPVQREFRTASLDWEIGLLALVAALLLAALFIRALFPLAALLLAAATLVAAFGGALVGAFFEQCDWVTPQPRDAPRQLRLVDSWHVVVRDCGDGTQALRNRIAERLRSSEMAWSVLQETYSFAAPAGVQSRERLVASLGQGHVHLHAHAEGRDLFIGWQSYLNWAAWAETRPVSKRYVGRFCVDYREIQPTFFQPSDANLIDLIGMSAAAHAALTQVVKDLMNEREVDQEIDFDVFHGDRADALDERKALPERTHERKPSKDVLNSAIVRRASLGQMKLAQPADEAGDLRAVPWAPAWIVLPALAAIGFLLVERSGASNLFPFRQIVASNIPLTFFPLLNLPTAIAIAAGLLIYARLDFARSVAAAAMIVAALLCTSFAFDGLVLRFVPLSALAGEPSATLFTIGAVVASGASCLLPIAIWRPSVVRGIRAVAGLAIWEIWAIATSLFLRFNHVGGEAQVAVILSLRVVICGVIGFWLLRDAAAPAVQKSRVETGASARRAPAAAWRGDRWLILSLLVLTTLDLSYNFLSTSFFISMLERELLAPISSLTPLFVAAAISAAVGSILSGALAEAMGRKRLIASALLVSGLASLLVFGAPSISTVYVSRILFGLTLGAAIPAVAALAAEFAPSTFPELFTNIALAGTVLAAPIGGALTAGLVRDLTLESVSLGVGAVSVLLALATGVFLKRSAQPAASRTRGSDIFGSLVAPLKTNQLARTLAFSGVAFAAYFANAIASSLFPFFVMEGILPRGDVSELISALSWGGAFGILVLGAALRWFDPMRVLASALALGALACFCIDAFINQPPVVAFFLFVLSACLTGSAYSAICLSALSSQRRLQAARAGWTSGLGRIGGLLGPMFITAIHGASFGPPVILWSIAGAAALGLLVALGGSALTVQSARR